MPMLNTVYQTMRQRIDDFYANASIFKSNRFFVGFWGEYVTEAIRYMEAHTGNDPRIDASEKIFKGYKAHVDSFNRWKAKHCYQSMTDPTMFEVELKWTCSSVTIPHIKPQMGGEDITIDAYKPIAYPLLASYGGKQTVSLTIVEDRDMNMYQFFNALQNQFFGVRSNLGKFADPRLMTPRSSFQKMGMYIAVVQEEFLSTSQESVVAAAMNEVKTENGSVRQDILDDVIVQVFEFNSVVPTGITDTSLDHNNKGQPLTYTVQFSAPNTFQQPYKMTFRGLRNTTSDPLYLKSVDVLVDASATDNGGKSNLQFGYLGLDYSKPDSISAFEDEIFIDPTTKKV